MNELNRAYMKLATEYENAIEATPEADTASDKDFYMALGYQKGLFYATRLIMNLMDEYTEEMAKNYGER